MVSTLQLRCWRRHSSGSRGWCWKSQGSARQAQSRSCLACSFPRGNVSWSHRLVLVRHSDDGSRRGNVTMTENDLLAERFEAHRNHLRRVAYRMLGSAGEADDAVQEAWLRLSGSDATAVDNLGGWLTTIVGRICLDMLRSRKALGEEWTGTLVH